MTIPVYPDHLLPCFLTDGHKYKQQNTIQKTTFLSGRDRSRRLFDAVPETFQVSTLMSDYQLMVFEGWIHHKVKDVGAFDVKIHTARGYNTERVKLDNNGFEKEYQGGRVNGLWKISLTIKNTQQGYISEADLDALL